MQIYEARGKTSITLILAGIIIGVFVMQILVNGLTEALYFDPGKAMVESYRFVTSIFLHAGLWHLFLNLYALILFGSIVESAITRKDYLIIFLGSGIFGSLLYYLTVAYGISPNIPALGASGAIFGIMGAAAVLFPNVRIILMFIPMRIKEAAILWIILEFIGTFNPSNGIANAAHLGGLIFGITYAKFLAGEIGKGFEINNSKARQMPWEE